VALIKSEQVVASLSQFISDNLTVSTTVIYPGQRKDTGAINDWIELWITRFKRNTRRRANKDRVQTTFEAVCYAKRTTNIYRIMDIVVDVANQLEHAEVPIKDYDAVGTPTIGFLRIMEPKRRDNTRNAQASTGTNVRTLTLEFPASAQEL